MLFSQRNALPKGCVDHDVRIADLRADNAVNFVQNLHTIKLVNNIRLVILLPEHSVCSNFILNCSCGFVYLQK